MLEPCPVNLSSHSYEIISLPSLLKRQAQQTPHTIAITAPGRVPLTYGRLFTQVETIAATLKAQGLGAQDRVAVVLPNGPEMAVAFLSIASTVTCAPLNPAYRIPELEFYLNDLEAKAVVVQSDMETPVRKVAQTKGIPFIELIPTVEAEAGVFTLDGKKRPPPVPHGRKTRAEDVALVLHTSGTTARPKLVPLTHANLVASANHIVNSVELTPHDCCLNIMPLFHIHGLVGALLSSLAAGSRVVCTPGFSAPDILGWIKEFRATWYTAVPTMHQGMVCQAKQHPSQARSVPLRFIRSSSASLPPSVMKDLEETFSCPVIEAYGMTEAAHQMSSNPLGVGKQKPGSVGQAAGPDMVIIDEQGERVPSGERGEVAIRGSNVMAGYDHNPEANDEAFTNGWFRTGDQGYLDPHGYLFLTGRLKEMINRGGEKIAPREIDEVLLSHPAVAQAVTFAMSHPTLGEEVAAAVVLSPGATCYEWDLQEFAATRIAAFKVPRRIVLVEDIPKGPTGKLQRIGLHKKLTHQMKREKVLGLEKTTTDSKSSADGPRTPLETTLVELWYEVLRVDTLGVHDDFFALGGDSLSATRLLNRLRERLQVELSFEALFGNLTIAGLARLVETTPRLEFVDLLPLRARDSDEPVSLSFAQQRLWFLNQLEPESVAYHRPVTIEITGFLDVAILERCLNEIIRRHEILRTTIQEKNEQPIQVITPPKNIPLTVIDLSDQSPSAALESLVKKRVKAEAHKKFDLSKGPLIRVRLFKLEEKRYIFLLTIHHIIFDGWSQSILLQELIKLYNAFSHDKASPLPALSIQYADFASFQRSSLEAGKLEHHVTYWQMVLKNAPLSSTILADYPRPSIQTNVGAVQSIVFPKELLARLQDLSRREEVSLFMTLLAGFNVLLFRYTGKEDVIVGVPVAGRSFVETEKLIGLLINMLPLRVDLSGNPTFQMLLNRVKELALSAYDHQDLPFEKIVEEVRPERSLSLTPLFQISFQFRNYSTHKEEMFDLYCQELEVDFGIVAFDLEVDLMEVSEGLQCWIKYNTSLFHKATIIQLLNVYQTLLEGIVAGPSQLIGNLPLLGETQKHQILDEWNNTQTDFPRTQCIHHLFEEQVEKSPHTIAVTHKDQEVTYEELNTRANQLAHYLQRQGAGLDVPIGLCVDRSLEMVVGLFGILKAGGVYLPLDPSYPHERLAFMITDTQCTILLTQQPLLAKLPAFPASRVICLDTDWARIGQESSANLSGLAHPETLAYVIYTSGSTGRPKGVLTSHQGLTNQMLWMQANWPLSSDDRILQKTPFGFDVSLLEFFWPLLAGARLIMARPRGHQDSAYLREVVVRQGITTIHFVPSMLSIFLEELELGGDSSSLRRVFCGGETLPVKLQERFFHNMGADLLHFYGPTEASIQVTGWTCKRDEQESFVPLGLPVANTQTYVLDGYSQLLPIGVQGELCIGGVALARGYLHSPEQTAEVFVPNPYSDAPGARLYRTGDLTRYRSDGRLEFLGRYDHQVKLRGFRIELGEIEALLRTHPDVQQVVTLFWQEATDDQRLIAYLVLYENSKTNESALKTFLKTHLPDYMIPSALIIMKVFPLTVNGKVDRAALPQPNSERQMSSIYIAPKSETEKLITAVWQELLQLDKVGLRDNFFDLGGHSLLLIKVHRRLQNIFSKNLSMIDLFRHSTIEKLAEFLTEDHLPQPSSETTRKGRPQSECYPKNIVSPSIDGIAIIGFAGQFPGANNMDQFWVNLKNGVESISRFTKDELLAKGISSRILDNPSYIKAGVVLDDFEHFDATFFGFNPKDAEKTDPQQRIFLEAAWEALENSGYNPDSYDGSIGIYGGSGENRYLLNLPSHSTSLDPAATFQESIGNEKDFLATRVSYHLNLKGPSFTVQTACSTSLTAIHLACNALLARQCDMAMAGGVRIVLPHGEGYVHEKGMILSPDGHCRAFDAAGEGIVRGSGVGIVVLKHLSKALEDGDTIHAVIRGSAINNDGANKVGFTAPSVDGQATVISRAISLAGVNPETISYVEAHGTGTPLGDPIEISALTQAFKNTGCQKKEFCAIGSVKTNIGHLDAAAGVTGLIKTVLALQNKKIPPSLNYKNPNPKIDFKYSPFYVNTKLCKWKSPNGTPRRAGISSFGIGGTNAHVILEEAPKITPSSSSRAQQLLLLSAKTESALETATSNLVEFLKNNHKVNLADVAHTLQLGRKVFNHRRMVSVSATKEAISILDSLDPTRVTTTFQEASHLEIVFMFPGQGSQYANMGLELYKNEPEFKQHIDQCSEILEPYLKIDIRNVIFPKKGRTKTASRQLNNTLITQPALFVIEYALAKHWISWGIQSTALVGHSIGEYVSACLAGVFSLEDALQLVAVRGKLMQGLPRGAMVSVPLAEKNVTPYLNEKLSLAAINAPSLCVVSGEAKPIAEFTEKLAQENITCQPLHTSHAFHSSAMDPILEAFTDQFKNIRLHPPQIPIMSTVTGTWVSADDMTNPEYWAKNIRQTVRFSDCAKKLTEDSNRILLEVGPGQSLATLVRQQAHFKKDQSVTLTLPHPKQKQSSLAFMVSSLGKLWVAGARINWSGFYKDEKRHRLPLPTYPFERQRYWIEPNTQRENETSLLDRSKKRNISDWFYTPSWKQSPLTVSLKTMEAPEQKLQWLVLMDTSGLGKQLGTRLQQIGQDVISVSSANQFTQVDDQTYTLKMGNAKDYEALVKTLHSQGKLPDKIVHLWGVGPNRRATLNADFLRKAQDQGFYSLLFLSQSLGHLELRKKIHISVVSNNMQEVTGDDGLYPEKATVLGPVKVISQEYPKIRCQSIDIEIPRAKKPSFQQLVEQILTENMMVHPEPIVAYRGKYRWVQSFEPIHQKGRSNRTTKLRQNGTYLITGGLGKVGLILAENLAKTVNAQLVLVGRSDFPPRQDWEQWLFKHGEANPVSQKIRTLQKIKAFGAGVLIVKADIADTRQMEDVILQAQKNFGQINGVIHAAGAIDVNLFKEIQRTRQSECLEQFEPKVEGLLVLNKIFHGYSLDFCLAMSSLSSVLGGIGFVTYSAANLFMDAFVHATNLTSSLPWISINWDRWRFSEQEESITSSENRIEPLAIFPEEGATAFQEILSFENLNQIVVSTGDLHERMKQSLGSNILPKDISPEQKSNISSKSKKKTLDSTSASCTPEEEKMCQVWQELLGVDQIGIDDNFFELGGHSLIIIQILSRIRETFNVDLPIRTFFDAPTVRKISELMRRRQATQDDSDSIAQVLDDLGQLSEEEALAILEKEEAKALLEGNDPDPISTERPNVAEHKGDHSHSQTFEENIEKPCIDKNVQDSQTTSPHIRQEGQINTDFYIPSSYGEISPLYPQDSLTGPANIKSVAMITANRVESSKRALSSYIENSKLHGRKNNFVLMDDTADPQVRDRYQHMLRQLQAQYGVEIVYGGLEEKKEFAKALIKEGDLPSEIVHFGLFDVLKCGNTYGANRNAVLLHTVGDAIFSADDDTVCRVAVSSDSKSNLTLSHESDPADIWVFPDRKAALASVSFLEEDILKIHEQLLGKNLNEAYSSFNLLSGEGPDRIHSGLLQRLATTDSRILVTQNGVFGDCGWGTPFNCVRRPRGYLLLGGESHKRIVQSKAEYKSACASREILRMVSRPTVSDDAFLQSMFIGLDNRNLLPPFMPVASGEDVIFGTTLWECFQKSYLAHLPWALLHDPMEKRKFWPGEIFRTASGMPMAKIILECIRSFNDRSAKIDERTMIRSLGKHLIQIGSLPFAEFEELIMSLLKRSWNSCITLMENELTIYGGSPEYWAHDVRKYIDIVRRELKRKDYFIPLDLMEGRDVNEVRNLSQKLVLHFGQLLYSWPEIYEAARRLRDKGIRLAQPA